MTTSTRDRAAREAAAGRLWRAKEILAGALTSQGYSPTGFAAYGRVLARMHDTKEAGKFLFLSGLAETHEAPTVEVFLRSVRGRPNSWIYSQFPGAARRGELTDFPERVRNDLGTLGFPRDFHWKGPPPVPNQTGKWPAMAGTALAICMLLLIVVGLLHGCYVVAGTIFGD
ncbi:MAG TPA: hypothetical protein VHN79_03700 [Lacunisphaera sp.]|nr:hypothetical protein [Lacunisphaera sp.]